MEPPKKILALQFKYFGDAVLMTPALRAIREKFPQSELHVLAPENIAPILEHLPWLNRVWAMPRQRGRASLRQTWPVIRRLRREHFDWSVDFASNDRGAILSFLIGAQQRLGWAQRGGFLGRRFCYSQRVAAENKIQHESARLAHLLSAWGIAPPASLELEIQTDPAKDLLAVKLLPRRVILCHMASSQANREWPRERWAELYRRAAAAGRQLAFTTAIGEREQSLTNELKKIAPDAPILPPVPELALFLSLLKRAEGFISGDTGPLHFAAGLGVPTLALFGPSSPARWAPIGARHRALIGSACPCGAGTNICHNAKFCLDGITPEKVLEELNEIVPVSPSASA